MIVPHTVHQFLPSPWIAVRSSTRTLDSPLGLNMEGSSSAATHIKRINSAGHLGGRDGPRQDRSSFSVHNRNPVRLPPALPCLSLTACCQLQGSGKQSLKALSEEVTLTFQMGAVGAARAGVSLSRVKPQLRQPSLITSRREMTDAAASTPFFLSLT